MSGVADSGGGVADMFLIGDRKFCRPPATAADTARRWRRRAALRIIRFPFWSRMLAMAVRMNKIDKAIKTALGGPIVAVAYYIVAIAVRYMSCLPSYTDAEFADIPVAQYLLLALTVAAAILTVFAMLAGLRTYRQSRRARGDAGRKVGRWGLAGIALGAVACAAIIATAPALFDAKCG